MEYLLLRSTALDDTDVSDCAKEWVDVITYIIYNPHEVMYSCQLLGTDIYNLSSWIDSPGSTKELRKCGGKPSFAMHHPIKNPITTSTTNVCTRLSSICLSFIQRSFTRLRGGKPHIFLRLGARESITVFHPQPSWRILVWPWKCLKVCLDHSGSGSLISSTAVSCSPIAGYFALGARTRDA